MPAQLATPKPKIRILIYTDNPAMENNDAFFGLQSMTERLKAHGPKFAELVPVIVCRSSSDQNHADKKINVVLDEAQKKGEPYDEIWLFGIHQANQQMPQADGLRQGPHCELDKDEVAALENWMSTKNGGRGGGVLITGDHANANPFGLMVNNDGPCGPPDPNTTHMGLGRAIGRCVPRAGALRAWEGPPTRSPENSFSTLASLAGDQNDRFPQHLTLRNVNADGDLDDNGKPHPLFYYRRGEFIRVFPDHHHEGAVVIPDVLDQSWPNGPNGQVRPQVVALGTDKRRNTTINIIATYNGDLAGVGRIVADSTWHHYTNANLGGFFHPAPIDTEADQIGQFYGNLAIWLAPRSKRLEMARAMSWELSRYTLVQEGRSDPQRLGDIAHELINEVASGCEIHELLKVLPPPDAPPLEALAMPESTATSENWFLGYVLDGYHQAMTPIPVQAANEQPAAAAAAPVAPTTVEGLIETAYKNTIEAQRTRLRDRLAALSANENNN